jgi:hypothetical protein
MPVYVNVNAHPISISLSEPRRSITVHPWAASPKLLPEGALKEVDLDARIGVQLVQTGQLTLKSALPQSSKVVAPVKPKPAPPAPVKPAPVISQDELDDEELDRATAPVTPSEKRVVENEGSIATPAEIDPAPAPKKRYRV